MAFSFCKVAENLGVMILTFAAGYLKVMSGGFIAVHALFGLVSLIATGITYHYIHRKKREAADKDKNGTKINYEDEESLAINDVTEEIQASRSVKEEVTARKKSNDDSSTDLSVAWE